MFNDTLTIMPKKGMRISVGKDIEVSFCIICKSNGEALTHFSLDYDGQSDQLISQDVVFGSRPTEEIEEDPEPRKPERNRNQEPRSQETFWKEAGSELGLRANCLLTVQLYCTTTVLYLRTFWF